MSRFALLHRVLIYAYTPLMGSCSDCVFYAKDVDETRVHSNGRFTFAHIHMGGLSQITEYSHSNSVSNTCSAT